MLTKVIKLFGYSYFLRINASIFRRNVFPPRSRGGYPQHRAVGLLLGEEPRIIFVVALVAVDDDVLGCRDQAVLDAAETAQRLLVGTRVEEPDVLCVTRFELGQEYGVGV